MIEKFIENFTEKKIENIVKIKYKYYLLENEAKNVFEKIPLDAEFVGTFLGEEKRGVFYPSLALLDILSKVSDKKIFVEEKAAWLFLCGRDIMGRGVIKSNVNMGLVLVQNRNDQNLGYGKISGHVHKRNDEIVVKTILDRGDYLRREMDEIKKKK